MGPTVPVERLIDPAELRRVAVVMLSTIGNAVHVLPVLNSIKRAAPGCEVSWILQPALAELIRGHPAVDELMLLDRSRGWRGWLALRRQLARRRFDVVLVFQDYFKAGVVAAMTRAPIKLGLDRARARDLSWLFTTHRLQPRPAGHVQDQYLEYLQPLGVAPVVEWALEPAPEERSGHASLLPSSEGPLIAFVVGTTRPDKEWPSRRYAELADRLHEGVGGRVVLVGGRSEREVMASSIIRGHAEHPPVDLLARDMRRLVALLEAVDVLVSPDTGPLHLARALGTPVVGLYGATDPGRHGPYRKYGDLVIDAYSPGEGSGPGGMEEIEVEDVYSKVELALGRYGSR
jgi:heptosyltransferase I